MPAPSLLTPDAVRVLPDDGMRHETVHGTPLMTPAPGARHQLVLERMRNALVSWLLAHGIEQTIASPADIALGPDSLVQPDLFVADLTALRRSWDWRDVQTLFLVVEVISPYSAESDRTLKRRLYQEHRIPEYWVVDPELRQVELWLPDAERPIVHRDRIAWRHPWLEASVTIDLPSLFDFD